MDIAGIGLRAVLQARGYFDPEKMKPESWPGGCQVTAHGGVKAGERIPTALCREVAEELGPAAMEIALKSGNYVGCVRTVSVMEGESETAITLAVRLTVGASERFLKALRLGPASGGIRLVSQEEVERIVNLRDFSKEAGVRDRQTVAMFPDEAEAVRLAFKKFV